MKTNNKKKSNSDVEPKPRTVKIADSLHHRVRVLSVEKRIPMQSFIEQLIQHGLDKKVYERFVVPA